MWTGKCVDTDLKRYNRNEIAILTKLRNNKLDLNARMAKIRNNEGKCGCCASGERETLEHYLIKCSKWKDQRKELMEEIERFLNRQGYRHAGITNSIIIQAMLYPPSFPSATAAHHNKASE